MQTLFSIPPEVRTEIYKSLTPSELFRILEASPSYCRQGEKERAIKVLFAREGKKAQIYQKKLIQSWFENHGIYPFPFTDDKKHYLESLRRLSPSYQAIGLYVMNTSLCINNAEIKDWVDLAIPQLICSNLDKAKEEWIVLLASKFSKEQLDSLLKWITDGTWYIDNGTFAINNGEFSFFAYLYDEQDNWKSQNENFEAEDTQIHYLKMFDGLHAVLTALIPRFNKEQINNCLKWIMGEPKELFFGNDDHRCPITMLTPRLDTEQIDNLFSQTLRLLKKRADYRHINIMLEIIVSKLNEAQLTEALSQLMEEMGKNKANKTLCILIPWLHEAQANQFFVQLIEDLRRQEAPLYEDSPLMALVDALLSRPTRNATQVNELLCWVIDNWQNSNNKVAQRILRSLIPKLNEKQIDWLFSWAEKELKEEHVAVLLIILTPKLSKIHLNSDVFVDGVIRLYSSISRHRELLNMDDFQTQKMLMQALPNFSLELNEASLNKFGEAISTRLNELDLRSLVDSLGDLANFPPNLIGKISSSIILDIFDGIWPSPIINDEGSINEVFDVHQEFDRDDVDKFYDEYLPALVKNLHRTQIVDLFMWTESRLEKHERHLQENHENDDEVHIVELAEILNILAPRLKELYSDFHHRISQVISRLNKITPTCEWYENDITNLDDAIADLKIEENIINCVIMLGETDSRHIHIANLLAGISKLLGWDTPLTPFGLQLGDILSRYCLPNNPLAIPIMQNLVTRVRNPDVNNDINLNALGQLAISWLQHIDELQHFDNRLSDRAISDTLCLIDSLVDSSNNYFLVSTIYHVLKDQLKIAVIDQLEKNAGQQPTRPQKGV